MPALGALAAEPLYLLADTAIVGHLGTPQLAALALAGTLLSGLATFCNFLVYGVTAQVAQAARSRRGDRAGRVGRRRCGWRWRSGSSWRVARGAAPDLIALLGGSGHVGAMATTLPRIGSIGLPCVLIAMAGQGYQRGLGELRGPLMIVIVVERRQHRA